MSRKIRLGIIGVGYGAKVHLPVFQSIRDVEISGICGSGTKESLRRTGEFGNADGYPSWKEMIGSEKVDAVSVVVPPVAHKEIVCAALEHGKHVLCEKPFGRNYEDAREMHQASKETSLVNAVNYQFRCERGIAALKEEIEKGSIGRVVRFDVTWFTNGGTKPDRPWSWRNDAAAGGGILNEFGCHAIDYVEWVSGQKIKRVYATSKIIMPRRKDAEGVTKAVTGEDSVDLACELIGGIESKMEISNCYPSSSFHRVKIYGSEGNLIWEHREPFAAKDVEVFKMIAGRSPMPIPVPTAPNEFDPDSRMPAFRKIAVAFVSSIRGEVYPDLPTFATGLEVHRVLELAKRSLQSGCMMSDDRD
jgi:predicted dehydrogenase